MVWFVFDEGNEWREAICRGPKALGTVFTGPYLSTRKTPLFYYGHSFVMDSSK